MGESRAEDGLDSPSQSPSILAVEKLLLNLTEDAQNKSLSPPTFVKVKGEHRPYANLTILQQTFPALLDSGASRTICGGPGYKRLSHLGFRCKRVTDHHDPVIRTADHTAHAIRHIFSIPVHFDQTFAVIEILGAPSLPDDVVLGIPFMHSFSMGIFTPRSVWIPGNIPKFEESFNCRNVESIKLISNNAEEYEVEEIEERQMDLTEDQVERLTPVVADFRKLGEVLLGRTNVISHDIDTGNSPPCFTRTRPMSPMKEKKVEQEFLRFKALGVVEPAQTAFRNMMTMVERYKSGKLKLRLCLDSRKLNAITKIEKYDLPRITTILSRLGKARFMSKIDLKDAYLQIPLTERSKEKTAFFVKGHGVWQFITMPFGLVNCSATMQRLMDTLFGDLDGMVFVYQDDLIIVNEDFEEHMKVLSTVADRLKGANLSINFEKCGFCLHNMRYMGYIVDQAGLRPDPEKISCVLKVPLPNTVTELRRFLGMAGWYRRFIKDFAELSAPLQDLLKGGGKGRKLAWEEKAKLNFEKLKLKLVSAPLLQPPDFRKEFIISCDASDGCIGGVLSQYSDEDPKQDRPIAYASRKLRGPEMHYSTTEKECLSVVFCLERFMEFVEGSEMTVYTDHSALTWLFKQKELSGRLARWVLSLQQHHMKIKHLKGKNNVVADAISRFPICQILEMVQLLDFIQPTGDLWYENLLQEVRNGNARSRRYKEMDGKLFYDPHVKGRRLTNWKWKLVIPLGNRKSVLQECHDDPKSAHLGVQKTIDRVLDRYYWPGLSRDVREYVKLCEVCKTTKHDNIRPPGMMGKYRHAHTPWQLISTDLLGPFPRSKKGNCYLLLFSDWLTKYPCIIPLKNGTAKNVTSNMENRIFLEYGVPQAVIMDNGSQYSRSNEVKALLKKYGIDRLWSNCIYHPQSNFTERHNKDLNAALRAYVRNNHKNWDEHLPEIALALRTAVNSITKYSPFFLNHAREFVFHASDYSLDPTSVDKEPLESRTEFIKRFKLISEDILSRIKASHARNKKYYDKNRSELSFKKGDLVYYRNFVLSNAGKGFCKKLAPLYLPGKITQIVSNVSYLISDPNGKAVGKFHVEHLRPRFIAAT